MSVYGRRDKQLQTELAGSSDAQASLTAIWPAAARPAGTCPAQLSPSPCGNDAAEPAQLLSVDLDDVLDAPTATSPPVQDYSRVIGYEDAWTHVAHHLRT